MHDLEIVGFHHLLGWKVTKGMCNYVQRGSYLALSRTSSCRSYFCLDDGFIAYIVE